MVYPRIYALQLGPCLSILYVNSMHVLTLGSQSIPVKGKEGKRTFEFVSWVGPPIPVSRLGPPNHLLLPRAPGWMPCLEPWAPLLRPVPMFSAQYRRASPPAAYRFGGSALHPSGGQSHWPHGTLRGTTWWGSSPGGPVPQAGSRPAPGPVCCLSAAPLCSAGSPCVKEGHRRRLVD